MDNIYSYNVQKGIYRHMSHKRLFNNGKWKSMLVCGEKTSLCYSKMLSAKVMGKFNTQFY